MRKMMKNKCMAAAAYAVEMFSCANIALLLDVTVVASIFVALLGLQLISIIILISIMILLAVVAANRRKGICTCFL